MVYEFKFPDIGEGITEGEIVEWAVKEGDEIKEHQALGKVETDKAIAEIPSPKAGTILKIYFKPGDTVKVGQTLVLIGEKGEKVPETKPEEKAVKKSVSVVGELEESEEVIQQPPVVTEAKKTEKEILATPLVRRLAKELSVDLSQVTGTGKGGIITESDVKSSTKTAPMIEKTEEASQTEMKVTKKYDMYGFIEHIPLKGVRKTIARHMVESKFTIPHVVNMDEVDVTELFALREKEKVKAEKEGIHLTFMPFIIKAVVHSLKKHPYANSSINDQAGEIILKKYYNIGFAVDTPDGLIVPVVKEADQKNMLEIAKEIEELAEKARKRTLDLGDLKGGTFTITNVGSIGGIFSTPIINSPEAAILAVGAIHEKPVVINGKIEIRKIMPLSLAFDHRIFDGAEAARFTNTLMEHLNDPGLLLIEEGADA